MEVSFEERGWIIKVTPGCGISVHRFPMEDGDKERQVLCELISGGCDFYEVVRPWGLQEINRGRALTGGGQRVVMLVDEEFMLRREQPEFNVVGSFLYGSGSHNPILGNILFVAEERDLYGLTLAGMNEELFMQTQMFIEQLVRKWEENCYA